jgi:hypothetical protein
MHFALGGTRGARARRFLVTIIESGIIAGIPAGAVVGGVVGRTHGGAGILGGSIAGLVSGAVAGWLYALLLIVLLSVVGVLWRAARKRADTVPTEADMKQMTPVAIRGTFAAALIALACWLSLGWPHALAAAAVSATATAVIAVARCELT